MGKHFGELATIRGIIYYKLSPHEQRAFAGAIQPGLTNVLRRCRDSVFIVLPPLIVGYCVYQSVEAAHWSHTRKNPRDFLDEVDPALAAAEK